MIKKLRLWFGGMVGESDVKTTQNLFYLFMVAIVVIAIVLLVVTVFMLSFCTFPPTEHSTCAYGEIGDLFGGILNPILTFLAFTGLLITIAVQKDELSQTREQLSNAASAQEEIASLQKSELINSTIYSLLEAMRDTSKGVKLHKKQTSSSGPTRHYTESGTTATLNILSSCVKESQKHSSLSPIEASRKVCAKEYDYISAKMSSYFEQLKYILEWIDSNSELKQSHRKLVVANMHYQDVYLAYIYSENNQQKEFSLVLHESDLMSFIPDHDTVFDKAYRKNV